MHPILFQIGPLTVYSYGVMLAVAVFLCALLLQRDAQKAGLRADLVYDLVFWVVVGGIVGGRAFFILLNLPFYWDDPKEIVMLHHGGLAWQGGLAAGAAAGFLFARKNAIPAFRLFDLSIPYVALGQALGRVGCFFNGCCYGKPVWWGIFSPAQNARLHPAQLYDALALLAIFFILKKYQKIARQPWAVFIVYLLLASLTRFLVEFFRGDHQVLRIGLNLFQFVSLFIFVGTALYARIYLKSR